MVWGWVVAVWGVISMSGPGGTVWVVLVIEMWVSVMLSSEAPVSVESLMAVEGIVISVHITVVVSVSPMSIIEAVLTEGKWMVVIWAVCNFVVEVLAVVVSLTVVWSTETPVTVESHMAIMRIVVSVAGSMSVSESEVTIIEAVLTEGKWMVVVWAVWSSV